jgi:hypothetical protein
MAFFDIYRLELSKMLSEDSYSKLKELPAHVKGRKPLIMPKPEAVEDKYISIVTKHNSRWQQSGYLCFNIVVI